MAKVYISGPTEENMKAITSMIKKKAMEYTRILMVDPTKVIGKMESNMVKEYLSLHKVHRGKESGMKVKESNGWTKMSKNKRWKFSEIM